MQTLNLKSIKLGATVLIPCFLLLLILLFPQDAFEAASSGLSVWLKVVFPSLLPFFIGSEVMIGLGVVDFLAVFLQPVMGPLFGCPGHSSFVWAMSVTSGYPVGAKLTSSLRKEGRISKVEGQRMLAFCSTSGPLFMIGAVGIGLLGSIEAGKIIAIGHYTAAVLLGLLFRFYKASDSKNLKEPYPPSGRLSAALAELRKARLKDGRPFGELLGDSVRHAVNTQLVIGGFIILFSVIYRLLDKIKWIDWFARQLLLICQPLNLDPDLLRGLAGGIFEVTVGCKLLSLTAAPMAQKIVLACFLIGFSGLSIHGQAASFISKTDLSIGLYLITKLCHGFLSAIIAAMSMELFYKDVEAFHPILLEDRLSWFQSLQSSLLLFTLIILALIACVLILHYLSRLHSLPFAKRNKKKLFKY